MVQEPVNPTRILNHLRLVKRRAEDRRMGHLAAITASDAAANDGGDGVCAQGIRIGLDRQRRTSG